MSQSQPQPATRAITLDIISDIACPWCAVGISSLNTALAQLGDAVQAELRFHPFELNPDMAPEGVVHLDYITAKYGTTAEQARANREQIRTRAAAVGFTMNRHDDSRVFNTFDAHRLLAWAAEQGQQAALKLALLQAYFTDNRNISDREVLVQVAQGVGLDGAAAQALLASDQFSEEVREEEALWRTRGINSVPAFVVNQRYLISGGQPPEVFQQQLLAILDEANAEAAGAA